jgi:hypothetical protein
VHPELQRRYTSLPLEFGLLDQELIGTDREEEAYKTRAIRKFEEIPSYRPETGAILPTEAELKQDGLQFAITTRANSSPRKDADPERRIVDPNLATATLRIAAGAGFRIHYRFRLTSGCWFLFGISDRST